MTQQSAALAALANGDSEVCMPAATWTVVSTPAAGAQASASRAAGGAAGDGSRNVCSGISASIAAAATAQTAIQLVLRDGASGAGTILWSKTLSAPAGVSISVDITGLCILGSPNTAMTLEFVSGGVAASNQNVTLMGVTLLK